MFEKEPQFFGKAPEKKAEIKEKPIERLEGFVREMSSGLKKEGIPVTEKGRIDMDQFEDVYPKRIIEADKSWLKGLRERWERAAVSGSQWSWVLSREQILKQKTVGEAWEMLVTAIIHKNLGNDFIVARSSEYDDVRNGVDSVIIDKKSGNIVCAFDEVGSMPGKKRFDEKKDNVLKRNQERGGADITYGISFKEGRLKKGRINHVPLFYLASSEEAVKKGLAAFSPKSASLEEREIFKAIVNSFSKQIEEIKRAPLHPKLRERLEFFETILGKLKDMLK